MFTDAASNATGTAAQETSDNLQTWDVNKYVTYFFYDASDTEDADPDYDKKWYSLADDSTPTSESVDAAQGAWYISRAATTLTVAGEVSKKNVAVKLQNGYNLVANPFPTGLKFNDPSIDWSAMGITGTAAQETSDNIQLWKGNKYATYFFYDASDTEDADPDYDKKWYSLEDDSTPTADSIPAGAGFWLIHRGATTTITLPSPIGE